METVFDILFLYNQKMQKACVLQRALVENEIEYDVRPVDPYLVRKFGKQISIFRRVDHFITHNHIDQDYKDFFNCLVNAIRIQGMREEH